MQHLPIISNLTIVDDDSNQTGQMLAGLLNWSQATCASKIEVKDKTLSITREIDGGFETLSTTMPAIITADLRLNEPRYATLPNIMKAKKKALLKMTPSELGVDITPKLVTVVVVEPPKRVGGGKVTSVDEVIQF